MFDSNEFSSDSSESKNDNTCSTRFRYKDDMTNYDSLEESFPTSPIYPMIARFVPTAPTFANTFKVFMAITDRGEGDLIFDSKSLILKNSLPS